MGIANELSSDVAAAVLARKNPQAQTETKELIEIVRNFHTTMRALTSEERRRRTYANSSTDSSADLSQANSRVASG